MKVNSIFKFQLLFITLISCGIWGLLLWQYFYSHVPSHHLLANPDLPSISNGWGALLIPVLAGFLLYRVGQRQKRDNDIEPNPSGYLKSTSPGFIGGFVYGLILALFFNAGMLAVSSQMVPVILLLAFFIPVYRAEYVLGFVLAMTYFFGAVLPTLFGAIFSLLAAGIHLVIRPMLILIFSKIKLLRR